MFGICRVDGARRRVVTFFCTIENVRRGRLRRIYLDLIGDVIKKAPSKDPRINEYV